MVGEKSRLDDGRPRTIAFTFLPVAFATNDGLSRLEKATLVKNATCETS